MVFLGAFFAAAFFAAVVVFLAVVVFFGGGVPAILPGLLSYVFTYPPVDVVLEAVAFFLAVVFGAVYGLKTAGVLTLAPEGFGGAEVLAI